MLFESLPEEILLAIVQHVPNASLPALATISHRLHRCVTPELYYFVQFQSHDCDETLMSKNDLQLVWESVLATQTRLSTRIVDLNPFLRSISESTSLRARVKAATFLWDIGDSKMINQLLDLLAPSVQFLHLSPPKYLPILESSAPITTLELDFKYLSSDYLNEQYLDAHVANKFYPLFCMPTLRALSFAGVNSWDWVYRGATSNRARTSNITCLSFPNGVPSGRPILEILTWPKALQSLSLDLSSAGFSGHSRANTNIPGPSRFTDALQQQKKSLEQLLIIGEPGRSRGIVDEKTLDLRGFPKLRRVALP